MAPGVPHLLHKPKAAINSGKGPGVEAEIHHPVEMQKVLQQKKRDMKLAAKIEQAESAEFDA